jgi:hypothetical protein
MKIEGLKLGDVIEQPGIEKIEKTCWCSRQPFGFASVPAQKPREQARDSYVHWGRGFPNRGAANLPNQGP